MSRLNVGNLYNENEDGSPSISGISTFSSNHYFVPPSGSTAERPSHADPGMIRFNTDSGHLEYYNGVEWTSVIVNNNELGVSGALGHRGLFMGGIFPTPSGTNIIDFITISTLSNSTDFGDLPTATRGNAACSSSTRGLSGGGRETPSGTRVNDIEYVTIASTGNAQDFGDLTQARENPSSTSSSTRGLFSGGYNPSPAPTLFNVIDYVTIASNGTNAQDFGDLSSTIADACSACSSPTRGLFGGGVNPSRVNTIEYITIASLGDAQDFGDLSIERRLLTSSSNSTRGIFAGGGPAPAVLNTIEYVTIASTGNAQDFGDLTVARRELGSVSSPIRAVFVQGVNPSNTDVNTMDYVTIASTGNAVDFGDTANSKVGGLSAACSNGHGGL